jgi:hypothetical protein
MNVELLKAQCNRVSEKLASIEEEVNEISDGLELLIHGCDSQALKNFMNTLVYSCKNVVDVSITEAVNELVDLEAGINIYEEENTEESEEGLKPLPGLTMKTILSSDGDFVEVDEKPVQKRTRRKKNTVNIDEIQEENAKILDEIFGESDKAVGSNKFMK